MLKKLFKKRKPQYRMVQDTTNGGKTYFRIQRYTFMGWKNIDNHQYNHSRYAVEKLRAHLLEDKRKYHNETRSTRVVCHGVDCLDYLEDVYDDK